MSRELDPREIARIKKLARASRIRRIRRSAAVSAATLATLFSAAIMARTQLDQSSAAVGTQTASVTRTSAPSQTDGSGGSGVTLSAPVAPAPLTTSQS